MKKVLIRSSLAVVAVAMVALLATSAQAQYPGTGTYVDAWPLHLDGNTVRTSDGDDGTGNVWYKGPESSWGGNDADRWYLESPDGGHNTAGDYGKGGDHYTWYEETRFTVPGITTTIGGLDPMGLYDVYGVYGSNANDQWGIYAAFSGGELQPYNASNGTMVNTGSGITYYESLIGNTQPNGAGEISVDIGEYAGVFPGGARTYYDGLTYVQTGVVPEPSTMALLASGLMALLLLVRRRR